MTGASWGLLAAFLAVLLAFAWPLGGWIARLLEAEPGRRRLARGFYSACGIDPGQQMNWLAYALAALFALHFLTR